ncbi:Membrane associated serine protease, rhomboid family [Flavobacterium succinicans]|uniref:Membrane associated serine protease, rhomboid family n=1 Tax=Flavobacterium succinicans TaxID=29536 RepID=A0A1I4X7D9_9FLAO|nr:MULTISPECIES: rhomboid family intramembrane serine protease [Flavobacterium]OOV27812.1 rhomboid family intramembrane serine protease [Flavobacterium sp. LM5]SFN21891.1 Membrane associated serine protease, rhomboid family [Flavobacterium succinicans]
MTIFNDLKSRYRLGNVALQLIFWNIGVFLIAILFFYQFKSGQFLFPNWLALSSDPLVSLSRPWTFLTYAFFHDGIGHLFFNMMVLHFCSQLFLTFFTTKQFMGLYVLSAIFSGIVFVLSYYFLQYTSMIVGASAAIYAILVATTTYQPLMQVQLFLFGNIKLWYITAVVLLLDVLQFRVENMGGHISHLAGALFGFVYIKLLVSGVDLSKLVSGVVDFFWSLFQKRNKTPFKKVHVNYARKEAPKTVSRIVTKDKTQQQIDEILDKISQSGYDCLTKEEKEFLFKAGK